MSFETKTKTKARPRICVTAAVSELDLYISLIRRARGGDPEDMVAAAYHVEQGLVAIRSRQRHLKDFEEPTP